MTEEQEDVMADAETFNRVARKKRVPRGMSEYQAAWIIDSGTQLADFLK